MSWLRNIFLHGCIFLLAYTTRAEVVVQLNINRPINDVSDKFISFTMKPEDLYKALDSDNRKTVTRMASMLSNSHVKFVGDYYFAAKTEGIRLRNPTKIVWKGFNKWTKAVNWTMIIPVPYNPDTWEPMETLKILNTSHMVDIDEAIWQLGTDFGTARAADYVSELKTFSIMVDSFKQDVSNWQTIGADISAGSSPEETRRYVEMSKDLNAAYGWIQSDDLFSSNSIVSPLDGKDPALKVLFRSKVPVWLTLPTKKTLSLHMEDEVVDGLQWAQNMGDAANIGFDTIFKPITLEEMEEPSYSIYVTALFKKIMGSRVYAPRPLAVANRLNKLYTHCANMISGGLALMVVNNQEQALHIAIRALSKTQDTEVWQYTLTMHKGQVMLNNNKLYMNSTLTPEIRRKNSKSMLQLRAQGMSVTFWVLPNANLDHCHFTEVAIPVESDEFTKKTKRYSSSDRLLKELIKETAKKSSFSPLAGLLGRHRRAVDKEDRFKRFILENSKNEVNPFTNLAGNFVQDIKNPLKRDIFAPDLRLKEWLSNILKEPLNLELPLLKRNARQSDSLKGPFFLTRDGKKTTFTKKITEIKKPEKKAKQFVPEDQEFDEEKFFKNVGEKPEPEYVRIPEGDVFLTHIAPVDGNEAEEELIIETKKTKKESIAQPQEIVSIMKPLRLLPTEFFEAMPAKPAPPAMSVKPNYGSSHLLRKKLKKSELPQKEMENETASEADSKDEEDSSKSEVDTKQERPSSKAAAEEDDEGDTDKHNEYLVDAEEGNSFTHKNSYSIDNSNYYAANTEPDKFDDSQKKKYVQSAKFDEIPWWDLSGKRFRRSLPSSEFENSWQENVISKEEDHMPAANEFTPTRLRRFENKVDEVVRNTNENSVSEDVDSIAVGKNILKTFKDQVTKFVDLFSHHASQWYTSFTKQFDSVLEENDATEGNRLV